MKPNIFPALRYKDAPAAVEWLCRAPARLAGFNRKGAVEVGYDADLVVWDPEASFEVTSERLYFKHKMSPYLTRQLLGSVRQTLVRGHTVFEQGAFPAGPIGDKLLYRGS